MKQTHLLIIAAVVVTALIAGSWYAFSFGSSVQDTPGESPEIELGEVKTDPAFENESTVVAVVNGEELSRIDFEALQSQIAAQQGFDLISIDVQTKAQVESQALDALVSQALLKQAAANKGVVASEEDVDEQIQTVKSQFESEALFETALTAQGMTEDDLRSQARTDIAAKAYLEQELSLSSVAVTDEEVEAVYRQATVGQEEAPPLEEAREQLEGMAIQQKQQTLIANLLQQLRAEADIQILI